MILRITRGGTVFSGSAADVRRLRETFDRRHWVRLPQLFEPRLLRTLQARIAAAAFYDRTHDGIGVELCMTHDGTSRLLHFLVNDGRLFELVRAMTGARRIGCFIGRVYRMVPGGGHYDSWHQDVDGSRLVAMSVNLGERPYAGGVLQIRERGSQRVEEVANPGVGDAVLFRIAPRLAHRVTRVESGGGRTAFAGWFCAAPAYRALLRKPAARRRAARAPGPLAAPRGRVRIADDVLFHAAGETTLVFDAVSACNYKLDGVGSRLWSLLAEGRSMREISGILAGEYAVDAEELARDVVRLVQDLRAKRLLVTGRNGAS